MEKNTVPWFKVDDAFALSPKVITAGNAAIGLWVRAGSWSMQQLTDGFIPKEMVPALGGKPKDVQQLIASGLWSPETSGYRFHDWSEYQPSRRKLEEEKEATRQRVEQWRRKKKTSGNVTRLRDQM